MDTSYECLKLKTKLTNGFNRFKKYVVQSNKSKFWMQY